MFLRRLTAENNIPHNTLVTTKYKHERFQYALNEHGALRLEIIPTGNIFYLAFLVVDPTVLVSNFTANTTHINCLDTDMCRLTSQFFKVHVVTLHSFKEHLFQVELGHSTNFVN